MGTFQHWVGEANGVALHCATANAAKHKASSWAAPRFLTRRSGCGRDFIPSTINFSPSAPLAAASLSFNTQDAATEDEEEDGSRDEGEMEVEMENTHPLCSDHFNLFPLLRKQRLAPSGLMRAVRRLQEG